MPKINRIRIINFAYNHDRRHILDETFNFYGGENALLSLANGGGKSVLVQLFLQPVVPGARLQGRPVISFFKRRKQPSYVLVEWKLDGGGGYLLTGVGLASQEVKGADENDRSRLRYFTFTVQYVQANAFDIAHIELVTRQGGLLTVKPFREAAQMLADKAKKDPVYFAYFTQDDQQQYASHLGSFGISQEEWRNIIARINDSESGLKEVFEQCRTSDQLLNTWLIKTVEKVLYRDREEVRRLEEMLARLVQEMVDNEQYIIEKEMLVEFINAFERWGASLADLVNGLDEEQACKSKLAAFYHLVLETIKRLEEEKTGKEEALEGAKTALHRLQVEEKSYVYYQFLEEYERLYEEWQAAAGRQNETAQELEAAKRERKRLEAARLAEEKRELSAVLAALEERISLLRQEFDTDGRIKSLEYSLKLGYEALLAGIEKELTSLLAAERTAKARQQEIAERLQSLDRRRVQLSTEEGKLEERIRAFEDYQKEVEEKLGFSIKRDLFGRFQEQDALKIKERLASRHRDLVVEAERLLRHREEVKTRMEEIYREQVDLQVAKAETTNRRQQRQQELHEYLELEAELAQICRRHGLDFARRFERRVLERALQQQVAAAEKRKYSAAGERDRVEEIIKALRKRRLHIPASLLAYLAEADIEFITGEEYLTAQPDEIRSKLLAENPLLPYALLMTRENLDKLMALNRDFTLRQAIPVLTYDNLRATFSRGDKWAQPADALTLMCWYEGRIFDAAQLESFISQLEQERRQYEDNYHHLEEALAVLRKDQAFVSRFTYSGDYCSRLEQELETLRQHLDDLTGAEQELALEREDLVTALQELEQTLNGNQQEQREAKEALALYTEFLAKNERYETARQQLEQIRAEKREVEAAKAGLEKEMAKLQGELKGLEWNIAAQKEKKEAYTWKHSLVQNAPEAPLEEGTVKELEAKLEALKAQHRDTLGILEDNRKKAAAELAQKEKELKRLGLPGEEYEGVTYREERVDWLEKEIPRLEELLRNLGKEESKARARAAAQESSVKHALEEVRKLNVPEPLAPSEIKGDFQSRRRQLNRELEQLEQDRQRLMQLIGKHAGLADRVLVVPGLTGVEPYPDLSLEDDPERQFSGLFENYRRKEQDNRAKLHRSQHEYFQLRSRYMDKKQYFTDIFAGLDPLWEQAGTEFATYYYLYERVQQQLEMLRNLLRFYENRMANLERSKQDMVQQSYFHGLQIYEELQKISECSRVRLQGRARPVDMLRINTQLEEGAKEDARQRVKEYVEECIRIVREDLRQGKREEEVQKTIARLMSSRELLNQLLGTSRIPVLVYKIELNMQLSRHKVWDEAIKENSGGEKFVVFFSVLAALMAYTRSSTMGAMGLDGEHIARVLIMDNPFGPISSEHLLRPLFDIAEKHNIQLICLSDLKQSSIMNCFDLIFMLKVRTGITGEKEYLVKEAIYTRDQGPVSGDEQLEKAVFKASEVMQVSMFDGDE